MIILTQKFFDMKFFLFVLFGLLLSSVFSQTIDYTNVRPGESVEYCTSHKKLQELLKDPEYKRQFEADQEQLNQEEIEYRSNSRKRGTVYIIPVVFHVLHSGGVENISDQQIFNALAILNRDFRLLNEDAQDVHSDFKNLPADAEIEFRMATIAPNGACFNGITRTYTTDTTTNGSKQVTLIKNGNNVYKGEWTGNKYMHIFVCKAIGGAAGYTYRPQGSGSSMTNGIWILHNYVGSIGTANDLTSRALTHEVGHWLNLMHTWGGNNSPGNSSSCSDPNQDQVSDTPPTIGVTWCNLEENSCGTRANVENYMDYSYCNKMFTPGQVTRMKTALQSTVGGRSTVCSANNLKAVGVTTPKLCGADFILDRKTICPGNAVNYTDLSFNTPTSWSWSFPGGTPSTSTEKNPVVIYNTPGLYSASLTVSNGVNSLTYKMDTAVIVMNTSQKIPFLESFNYKNLSENSFWAINNVQSNKGFEVYTGKGYTDTKCLFLNNFADKGKSSDELISGSIDLSGVKNANEITIQFRYAYAKSSSSNLEVLRLSLSDNCGDTWLVKKSVTSSSLSDITSTSSWYPTTESDWKVFTLTGISSNYWTKDFRIKIDFQGNGGNNLFIDDINIYPSAPSNDIVLGIEEFNQGIISISPNPVDDKLTLSISKDNIQMKSYQILDLTGKVIVNESLVNQSDFTKFEIQTSNLVEGVYLLKLESNEGTISKQFVVK
jgi:PKD repeat protein